MQNRDDLIEQLDTLLDVERDALLKGDIDALAGIVEQKEILIEHLSAADVNDASEVAPVNGKVRRNHVLLEQALKGIRNVSKKLSDIRQTRKAFDTYDQSGQKSSIEGQKTTTVEKRA